MRSEDIIEGGYILTPRNQDNDILHAPPQVREIYAYLMREANYQDNKYGRFTIKRGQVWRSYSDIREGTKWYVGWRKMTYSENQVKKTMKFLREVGLVATKKAPGGVLITVCDYDYYQNPENYESTTKGTREGTIAEPGENQCGTIYNNKKDKELIQKRSKKVRNEAAQKPDFIDEILNLFLQIAGDFKIINRGMERKAIGSLLKIYRSDHPGQDSEQTLNYFTRFFRDCLNIPDKFHRERMSPNYMANQYNVIQNILKNGPRNGRSVDTVEKSDQLIHLANSVYDE